MPGTLQQILFPTTMRNVPQRRLWLNLLRALHILSVSVVVGGVYFAVDSSQLYAWVIAMVLSGFGMFLIDLYASCFMLFELRGAAMVVKLLIVICLPFVAQSVQLVLLVLVLLLSALISHSRRRLRHHCLLPSHLAARLRPADAKAVRSRPV